MSTLSKRMKTYVVAGCATFALAATAAAGFGADLRLVDAVKSGNRTAVKALLQKRVDVNAPEADGSTALEWAVDRNDAVLVDLLLQSGANVNSANNYGAAPLYVACTGGKTAMAAKLLEAKADPNIALLSGETPLMAAVDKGNVEAVRLLLEHGAKTEAKETNGGQTALMWAVAEKHPDMVKLLVDHGADVYARSKAGFTPLLFAAQQGEVESARMMIAAGADLNETARKDGMSALMVASGSGRKDVALLLVDKGANPNLADNRGYTALHYASPNRRMVDVVKALLARGANPNARATKDTTRPGIEIGINLKGATPLFLAAAAGNANAVRTLMAGGADPLLGTEAKTTPLHVAAGVGNPQARDFTDEEQKNLLETTKLLVEAGGDFNAVGEHGWMPLHGAAYKAMDGVIEFLVSKGARLDVMDDYGQTPLSIASAVITEGVKDKYYQSARIVRKSTSELLLKLGAKPLEQSGIRVVGVFNEQQQPRD